jgi:hypothetical protein
MVSQGALARRPPRPAGVDPPTTLTGVGAATVSLGVAAVVGGLDAAISPGLGWPFSVVFLTVSLWVTARTRRRDLFSTVVLPPLAFAVAALVAALVGAVPHTGEGPLGFGAGTIATMGDAAPTLFAATALVLILALRRRSLERRQMVPSGRARQGRTDRDGRDYRPGAADPVRPRLPAP